MRRLHLLLFCVATILFLSTAVLAGGPQFVNFQGSLYDDNDNPVDDPHLEMVFSIYDVSTGGIPLWTEANAVRVTNGHYNVLLGNLTPFPDDLFTVEFLYLGIKVGLSDEMTDRVLIGSTPSALHSLRADSSGHAQKADSAGRSDHANKADSSGHANQANHAKRSDTADVALSVIKNCIDSSNIMNGTIQLIDLAQNDALPGQIIKWNGEAWLLASDEGGGVGTITGVTAGTGLTGGGTSGNVPISIAPNGVTGTEIADGASGVALIDLAFDPTTQAELDAHKNSGDHNGRYFTQSELKDPGTINGAANPVNWTKLQSVPAGFADGIDDIGTGSFLPLAGGVMTGAITNAGNPPITMGQGNFGTGNLNPGTQAFVAGSNNRARGSFSVISGGGGLSLSDSNSTTGYCSTVGGGQRNVAAGDMATVSGGWANMVFGGQYNTIAGGQGNFIFSPSRQSTIGGGASAEVSGNYATVSGGNCNGALNDSATVGGGTNNIANGISSTVPGGGKNTASGAYSFAAGRRAKAMHTGTFVWADYSTPAGQDFTSTGNNQFLIRASGGVGIGTENPQSTLDVNGTVQMKYFKLTTLPTAGYVLTSDATGVGTWQPTSSTSGIVSLNGLTAGTQTFAVGTSGADIGISSSGTVHTFNIPVASSATTGRLSYSDWSTFNSKEPAITAGTPTQVWHGDKAWKAVSLNDDVTGNLSVLHLNGGTGALATTFWCGNGTWATPAPSGIVSLNALTGSTQMFATNATGTDFTISSSGSTHTFSMPVASATTTGKLSSVDWTTFNNKQAAGNYITALTGDVTATGPGSAAATIASRTSAQWAGKVSDETGTGAWVFGTTPTFTTNLTSPLIIGGGGSSSTLALRSTSGAGGVGADIIFQTGNNGATEAMRILNSGSVGIGTTSPAQKLDVAGTVQMTGFKLYTSNPTEGYVLTSDAAGVGTWQPASGGGPFLPLAGGTMTGPISSTGSPSITMGQGNFGTGNLNPGTSAFVAGSNNRARGAYSVVGGGGGATAADSNSALGNNTFIGGGKRNVATVDNTTIAGGSNNRAAGTWATIGGGDANTASGSNSTVSGGNNNTAGNDWAAVGGGTYNIASGTASVVSGGESDTASGEYAAVPGGSGNKAAGDYSLAAGRGAKANHNGCFVWSDGTTEDFASTASNQVLIRASGGVGIGTTSPQGALDVSSTTGAFIVPRMTTTQRNSFTAVNGMIIYNTTENKFNFYEAGAWVTK